MVRLTPLILRSHVDGGGGPGGGGGGGDTDVIYDLGNASDYTDSGTLLDGLEGAWSLSEAGAGTRFDSRGNYDLSVITGTPAQGAGHMVNATVFDGSTQVNAAVPLILSTSWYFCFWMKNPAGAGQQDVCGTFDNSHGYASFSILGNGHPFLDTAKDNGATNRVQIERVQNIRDDTWHFVEYYFDAANLLCGIEIDRSGSPTTAAQVSIYGITSGPMLFGALGVGYTGSPFIGSAEAGLYYQRMPTDAERNAIYAGGAGLPYPFGTTDIVVNLSLGTIFTLTLDIDVDSLTFSNQTASARRHWDLAVTGSGSHTITPGSGVVLSGGSAPVASSGKTRLPLLYDGSDVIVG